MRSRKDLVALTNEALAANVMPQVAEQAPAPVAPEIPGAAPSPSRASRTAPGVLMAAMGALGDRDKEASELRRQLAQWEGAYPARRIDTQQIDDSRYANRDPSHYDGQTWEAFKAELLESGGNVQPIVLRPSPTSAGRYEIVFGHRRTRACRESGLPVLAVIVPVNDQDLFLMMERENRSREDLSPWEQGESYRRALRSGLYKSLRQLAQAVGRDAGIVSRYVAIADLPEPVLKAFRTPTVIQKRWGELLSDAVQRDPDGVLSRATGLASSEGAPSPSEVLATLLGVTKSDAQVREIRSPDGIKLATVQRKGKRGFEVQFVGALLSDAVLDKVVALLEKNLKS